MQYKIELVFEGPDDLDTDAMTEKINRLATSELAYLDAQRKSAAPDLYVIQSLGIAAIIGPPIEILPIEETA